MAAALECWSGRPSTDEDVVEQVLMKGSDRSEMLFPPPSTSPSSSSSSAATSPSHPSAPPNPKKWQRLGRNLASTLSSLKNNLLDSATAAAASPSQQQRLDKLLWGSVVRHLTHLYPGSQLPDKLLSDLRRHFDSLPTTYALAGFDIKDVLLHAKLLDLSHSSSDPAVHVQDLPAENALRVTFACSSPLSWPAVSGSLDGCTRVQIFEKKGVTLGVAAVSAQPGGERQVKARVEAAIRSAIKRRNAGGKLPFGLCGCQDDDEADDRLLDSDQIQLASPLPESSVVVSVDEWQAVRSGGDEVARWMLGPNEVEFADQTGASSFRGVCRGKRVWIKRVRGCERGSAYEFELRRDLLQLMTCGHRNILQFVGVCIDEGNGLCVAVRMMEGGSVHDSLQRGRKKGAREAARIALDVAEGLMFMNSHGVAYRDLNAQRILLDRQGNAFLGDMGIVTSGGNAGEVTEYETAGFRWLAPEIIAGDPETVTETWMSNVYSFGMVVWEMVTGEAAYSSYSPVQAAVGIAACGLRPEIPRDCPQVLRSLMMKCWNNCPSKRPRFSEIISILRKQTSR